MDVPRQALGTGHAAAARRQQQVVLLTFTAAAAASFAALLLLPRYVPDRSYLRGLLSHLEAQLPACGPDGLSLAVWGLAALRQPLPSKDWGQAWCSAALACADRFGPQALAHGLSAMAALRMEPPAELMQVRQGCV